MSPGMEHLAASSVLIAHTSLVPAGAGVVAALVALSAPAGVAVGGAGAVRRPPDLPVPTHDPPAATGTASTTVLWQLAAVATAASGVVHAVAAPHHAAEHLVLGAFFSLSAVAQFAWATLALLVPQRRLLWHGVWLNLLLVVLWAVSRTVGLPLLLDGPEPVGTWDLGAKLWELGATACCLGVLFPAAWPVAARVGPGPASSHGRLLVWAAVAVSVLALVTLGLSGPPT